jgi:DNA-3-methyladenine glycosylase
VTTTNEPLKPRTKRLGRAFYDRPVVEVARDCIGKLLVHETNDGRRVGRIVEVEAYRGPEDRAAHSFGGRRTPRTEVMFGPPGHSYVFFLYGMHWNFNVVTGAKNEPCAVLVRGVEPVEGVERMAACRGMASTRRELTNGPAKLCQAFDINREHYGLDLCQKGGAGRGGGVHEVAASAAARASGAARAGSGAGARPGSLFLADGPAPSRIATSPRIGIDYAGSWAKRPWRFFEPENRYVSGPARARLPRR